jgi:dihydrofolate synthase/folylpolyglutamate synthase
MTSEILYQQTLDYLYGFVDYSLTRNLRNLPENFDLDRMRLFLEHFGNPEKSFPVIHVAGTKGKGSVCAFIASALQAAGYKVGLYTSPHLQDYTERIQIDRRPIQHDRLVELVNEIRPFLDQGTRLTTFEITTGLAFLYFAQEKMDVVVAEVGLGGRLDATNVVDPLVTVITSISYDHTQVLGNTLSEIAAEKGGIIKPFRPLVLSPQQEEARQVLERLAMERNAPLIQVGRDYIFEGLTDSLEGQSLEVRRSEVPEAVPIRLDIPLLGAHQVENAATAYAALQTAAACGLPVSIESIQSGFSQVSWSGRFEVLRRNPPIVVDSAHNRDSARRLVDALDRYFPREPVILVFGASEDKDIRGMLQELLKRADTVIFTRSYHPRAIEPTDLIQMVKEYQKTAFSVPKVEDALEEALRLAGDEKMILVTGSIFIAAGALQSWYNRNTESGNL